MSLLSFVESADGRDRSVVVVNRESPQPLQDLLEELLGGQPVSIVEEERPDDGTDRVYLVEGTDVVATSTLDELAQSILLVNSDLYITGARRPTELDLPAVITGLEDTRFSLRGYPESNKEKLLLITISRYIEGLAIESGSGTLRAAFQRLSRINDESGTRWVYDALDAAGVDTHVYGIPDWLPTPPTSLTIHGGWSTRFTDSWFVTFVPEDPAGTHAALVAIEVEPRVWEGCWTFDTDRVLEVTRYIQRSL